METGMTDYKYSAQVYNGETLVRTAFGLIAGIESVPSLIMAYAPIEVVSVHSEGNLLNICVDPKTVHWDTTMKVQVYKKDGSQFTKSELKAWGAFKDRKGRK
jgi:hypothetical protein